MSVVKRGLDWFVEHTISIFFISLLLMVSAEEPFTQIGMVVQGIWWTMFTIAIFKDSSSGRRDNYDGDDDGGGDGG